MSPHAPHPAAALTGSYSLLSPATAPGAIALILLRGDLSSFATSARVTLPAPGRVSLHRPFDLDDALLARLIDSGQDSLLIMPHGGIAITRSICNHLEHSGFSRQRNITTPPLPQQLTPGWLHDQVFAALARAHSPLAIDLLLDQPARWCHTPTQSTDDTTTRQLNYLLNPPTVVALGPSNIGKSTLINALARNNISIVADQPGTTRDYVTTPLEVDGLVVNYIDAPGLRPGADVIESQAIALALAAASSADLLLLCTDPRHTYITLPAPLTTLPALRLCLRADLALSADHPPHNIALSSLHNPQSDLNISSHITAQLTKLAKLIRQTLVPDSALTTAHAWPFWQAAQER
jgi:hypothetical protein